MSSVHSARFQLRQQGLDGTLTDLGEPMPVTQVFAAVGDALSFGEHSKIGLGERIIIERVA